MAFADCRGRYSLDISESDARNERPEDGVDTAEVDALISRRETSSGAESANSATCSACRGPTPRKSGTNTTITPSSGASASSAMAVAWAPEGLQVKRANHVKGLGRRVFAWNARFSTW